MNFPFRVLFNININLSLMKRLNLFLISGLSFMVIAATEIPRDSVTKIPEDQNSPCTPESAKKAPGKWTVDPFTMLPANPALPALVKNFQIEADLIHKALGEPVGFNARCYFYVADNPFIKKTPHRLEVNVPFFHYYCDNGKLGVNEEYSDGALLYSNSTWPMGGATGIKLGDKTFRTLGSPIGEIHGYPAFEADWSEGPAGATFTWVVLVKKKEIPLYRYASKEEILDHLEQMADKTRSEYQARIDKYMIIRPEDVQAEERKAELASFLDGATSDGARKSRTERFNKEYRNDLQKKEDAKKKATEEADKVDASLTRVRARYSPEQLKEPGYVANWLINYNEGFDEINFDFDEPKTDPFCRPTYGSDCQMGKPFALFNKSYLDPALPSTSAQYFTLAFRWTALKADNYRNPQGEKLRDEFFARFDFDQLAALLGK
jgi:hypothetical protein